MLSTVLCEAYLLVWSEASRTIPDKKKAAIIEVLRTGAFMFLFGFFIWNLDNIFCDPWTRIKQAVGWPMAFLLEGRFATSRQDYAILNNTLYRSRMVACTYCKRVSFLAAVLTEFIFWAQGLGTFYVNQGITCALTPLFFLSHTD